MEENLKNAFQKARYEPNQDLKDRIWNKITLRSKRIAYFRMISLSFVGLASFVGLIPMLKILANDFIQSGFYEYLALAFSSNSFFSSYWKEFVFSLAEALPTMSIVFSLALIFIFFLSLRYLMKQIIKGQSLFLQLKSV
jgi:hypothetical protein